MKVKRTGLLSWKITEISLEDYLKRLNAFVAEARALGCEVKIKDSGLSKEVREVMGDEDG